MPYSSSKKRPPASSGHAKGYNPDNDASGTYIVKANVYNGAAVATTYSLTDVTAGSLIGAASINAIRTAYASECTRRGLSAPSGSTVSSGTSITSSQINNLKASIERTGARTFGLITTSSSGGESVVSSGSQLTQRIFPNGTQFVAFGGVELWGGPNTTNPQVDRGPAISVAGFVTGFAGISTTNNAQLSTRISATDINALIKKVKDAGAVCLCNCNYCTCNCNYSCTCNCNYSDRRLKRNIKYLKNIFGINVYSFSYIWSNETFVGVMAQELLKTKYSNAVYMTKNGFYMVNYSELPFEIK